MGLTTAFRQPTVGLDIGTSGVRAVALRQTRAGWSLTAAGEMPMPVSAVAVEGDVPGQASAEVSGAIRDLFSLLQLRGARVAAALSGHAVIVKRLSLPAMSREELAEAIPWEAEQYVPFDLSDVHLDYQVVNERSETAKTQLDVLLVAAKKDRVDDRTGVIADAGRQAVVLDIEAFALANAYQMNYPERASDPLAAIVHIGRTATIACLIEHGQLAFTRDISLGGRVYADALHREFGVDAMTAERIQRGQVPADLPRDQVQALLRDASGQLILEVRKTVDFYRATAPIEKLSRIVLSGGASAAEGLVDLLGAEFDAPVEIFDPFRRVIRRKGAIGADVSGPAYAVAVGLAMRREGDR